MSVTDAGNAARAHPGLTGNTQAELTPLTVTFEDFYRAEYRSVVGLLETLSEDRAAAEDLAQEAFLAAKLNWTKISHYDKPGAWVRRVAIRGLQRWRRRRILEWEATRKLRMLTRDPGPVEFGADDELPHLVRCLPRRQRQVVVLHYQSDFSVVDIAELLGISEGAVKKHLHDGRKALARRLGMQPPEGREAR